MEYFWKAQYNDGTTLFQVEGDKKNAYEDIDRSKLEVFSIYRKNEDPVLDIIFDGDGDKLVWTRRVRMYSNDSKETFHIVGKKGEFILALTESGRVLARHNFKEDGLFYEVL